tara:strand:+ start:21713 stop:22198 length:486 start_codon:yes stop_codon:yes gene_type:complete
MTLVANKKRRLPVFGNTSIFQHPLLNDVMDPAKELLNMDPFFNRLSLPEIDFTPAVNVKEQKNNFKIEVAAPGFSKEDFDITIKDGMLNLTAEKENKSEEEKEGYVKKEFSFNRFNRAMTLPESIDEDKDVKAIYKDGILHLTLLKKEDVKAIPPKKVKVT